MAKRLIVGSNSPRRRQIMEMAGYTFDVLITDKDEHIDPATAVHDVPEQLAVQKAQHILPNISNEDFILLTADTVVILDGRIIGKPADIEDARSILGSLSGQTHEVVSGVCLCNHTFSEQFSSLTRVHFAELTEEEIENYITEFDVLDKAGAYAIQEGIGLTSIDTIEGSYYNVMGLPVHQVYRALNRLGYSPNNH